MSEQICRTIVAGHSHIAALGVPLQGSDATEALLPIPDAPPGFYGLTGSWNGDRTQEYWQALVAAAEGKTIVLSWSGNEHNALFLLHTPPDFDFRIGDPGLDRPDASAILVPKLLMAEALSAGLDELSRVVEQLNQSATKVLVLGSPPPKRQIEEMQAIIASSEYWQRRCKELKIDPALPTFSPAYLRLKLWMVLQEAMKAAAEAAGAAFVPVPAPLQDEDGFLKREYWEQDFTHANRAYGRVVLAHLASELRPLG